MSQELVVYTRCSQCGGTGMHQSSHGPGGTPIVCNWPGCDNGYIPLSKIILNPGLNDLEDKIDDIKEKCDEILAVL